MDAVNRLNGYQDIVADATGKPIPNPISPTEYFKKVIQAFVSQNALDYRINVTLAAARHAEISKPADVVTVTDAAAPK